MTDVLYQRDSEEYVRSTLTETSGVDLTSDTVVVAIYSGAPTEWLPAVWEDDEVRTTDPVLFDAENYPKTNYYVAVKVTDNPETPIVKVGRITIGT